MTGWGTIHARLTQPSGVVIPRIRDVVRSLDPLLPVYDVETLADSLGAPIWRKTRC